MSRWPGPSSMFLVYIRTFLSVMTKYFLDAQFLLWSDVKHVDIHLASFKFAPDSM